MDGLGRKFESELEKSPQYVPNPLEDREFQKMQNFWHRRDELEQWLKRLAGDKRAAAERIEGINAEFAQLESAPLWRKFLQRKKFQSRIAEVSKAFNEAITSLRSTETEYESIKSLTDAWLAQLKKAEQEWRSSLNS